MHVYFPLHFMPICSFEMLHSGPLNPPKVYFLCTQCESRIVCRRCLMWPRDNYVGRKAIQMLQGRNYRREWTLNAEGQGRGTISEGAPLKCCSLFSTLPACINGAASGIRSLMVRSSTVGNKQKALLKALQGDWIPNFAEWNFIFLNFCASWEKVAFYMFIQPGVILFSIPPKSYNMRNHWYFSQVWKKILLDPPLTLSLKQAVHTHTPALAHTLTHARILFFFLIALNSCLCVKRVHQRVAPVRHHSSCNLTTVQSNTGHWDGAQKSTWGRAVTMVTEKVCGPPTSQRMRCCLVSPCRVEKKQHIKFLLVCLSAESFRFLPHGGM